MTYREDWASFRQKLADLDARVLVLENDSGAPTQTYPGQLQFTAATSSISEGGSTTIRINRVGGSSGAASCALSWVASTAGTNVLTYNGAAITSPQTIAFADGVLYQEITISNQAASLSQDGTLTFTIASFSVAAEGVQSTHVLTLVNGVAAGTTGTIVADTFTTNFATGATGWSTTALNSGGLSVVSNEARFTLTAGTINNQYLEKNFGTEHTVGGGAVSELYGKCKVKFTGGSGIFATTNTNKIVQINWMHPTDSANSYPRQHQVQLLVDWNGTAFEYLVEKINFDSTGGFGAGSSTIPYATGVAPTYDEWLYFKWRIKNSTSGASDGVIQFWLNDVLIVDRQSVAVNDSRNFSPNRFLLSSYAQGANQATNGYMYIDDLTVQTDPLGSWAPTPSTGTIWQMDLTAANYGASELITTENNVVSVVADTELGQNVLKMALGPEVLDQSGAASYAGFRLLESLVNPSIVAAGTNSGKVYFQMLVKCGDTFGESFWEHDGSTYSELKIPNISQSGQSRWIGKLRPGGSNTMGRYNMYDDTLATNHWFDATGAGTGNINTGDWVWITWMLNKTGSAPTDTTLSMWVAAYDGSGTESVEGSPINTDTGVHWVPAGWTSVGGDWEIMYRGIQFLSGSTPVTRNLYIGKCLLSTTFPATTL